MINYRDWRTRLEIAISASGESKRAISLGAGMGPGYLHSITVEHKDPTIDNLIAVCESLDVNVIEILTGLSFSDQIQEMINKISDNPNKAKAILTLLED